VPDRCFNAAFPSKKITQKKNTNCALPSADEALGLGAASAISTSHTTWRGLWAPQLQPRLPCRMQADLSRMGLFWGIVRRLFWKILAVSTPRRSATPAG